MVCLFLSQQAISKDFYGFIITDIGFGVGSTDESISDSLELSKNAFTYQAQLNYQYSFFRVGLGIAGFRLKENDPDEYTLTYQNSGGTVGSQTRFTVAAYNASVGAQYSIIEDVVMSFDLMVVSDSASRRVGQCINCPETVFEPVVGIAFSPTIYYYLKQKKDDDFKLGIYAKYFYNSIDSAFYKQSFAMGLSMKI